ncbi:MAG: peptide ABC transporter permease [SAR92 bacterium BACL26 MAG-121220-bin70]|jgi:oligopeptide transport system permease protein|uniref:Oligopeptide transport system permease protein OppC n=1 Tax=SAR92 bacterium BACL26 MAG-121220-bin70 TaxID=1655626 RepID=A0A0R2U3G3_9GAMM|nr:MAG: peptide ABC transporter permease [SAR92 bacterium BACL26 MAG-121220-bin70]|tara:strand:+ start:2854 stop:3744 length:891 start_codon:yes stop_codon:yes gene_type:complete
MKQDSLSQSEIIEEDGSSLWNDAWIKLSKNYLALAGLGILILLCVVSLLTPWIAPYSYEQQNLDLGATAPSLQHWLGTDIFGRDMLTRIMYGGRVSLMVGFIATAVALVIGILWGAIAGFYGGRLDAVMMRIVDILYALPFMIFIVLLMVVFGRNILLLFLAIGAVEWLTMARIVRGQVMSLRNQEFVEAAYSLGLSQWTIIRRHIIPNTLGPVIVYTTLTIPSVMLLEAFLSFLGLGIQPPESSWGLLINYGVETMEEYPWLLIFPGVALSLTLFALNFLGDGLRDALDPRTSKD